MKVVYVRDARARGYTVLGIDSGEGARAYTVATSVYAAIGTPIASEEISDTAFSDIAFADECFRATKKALSLLALADNNRKNLRAKLVHAGFSRDAVDEVIADMLREGYINERRQLERLIESEVKRNLIGPKKLIPKLLAKGFSRTDINDALDALAADGVIDFSEAKRQLVMKKLGDSPDSEEVKKLLYKHGFSHSDDFII